MKPLHNRWLVSRLKGQQPGQRRFRHVLTPAHSHPPQAEEMALKLSKLLDNSVTTMSIGVTSASVILLGRSSVCVHLGTVSFT